MARCCGSTGTCACKIEPGLNTLVRGVGSTHDPYVVETDVALEVSDNNVFDIGLSGNGTREFPWMLEVKFSGAASLNDFPDVENKVASARTNGNVLGWNVARQLYELQPPTTVPAGAILHDNSLDGDGSGANALQVKEDPARMLGTLPAGLGLSDDGMNRIVRRFADSAARGVASPVPTLNALSILDSVPGRVDYWDGTAWKAVISNYGLALQAGELMQISGAYSTQRVYQYANRLTVTTGADGVFDALPNAHILTRGGVLSCAVQPRGSGAVPWVGMIYPGPGSDRIQCKAWRVGAGTPTVLANSQVDCVVSALLY